MEGEFSDKLSLIKCPTCFGEYYEHRANMQEGYLYCLICDTEIWIDDKGNLYG